MTVHDHFDGSAHCVECGGWCKLTGEQLGLTQFVRFTLESLAYNGWKTLPNFHADALRNMGLDGEALMRRAVETNGPRRGIRQK